MNTAAEQRKTLKTEHFKWKAVDFQRFPEIVLSSAQRNQVKSVHMMTNREHLRLIELNMNEIHCYCLRDNYSQRGFEASVLACEA